MKEAHVSGRASEPQCAALSCEVMFLKYFLEYLGRFIYVKVVSLITHLLMNVMMRVLSWCRSGLIDYQPSSWLTVRRRSLLTETNTLVLPLRWSRSTSSLAPSCLVKLEEVMRPLDFLEKDVEMKHLFSVSHRWRWQPSCSQPHADFALCNAPPLLLIIGQHRRVGQGGQPETVHVGKEVAGSTRPLTLHERLGLVCFQTATWWCQRLAATFITCTCMLLDTREITSSSAQSSHFRWLWYYYDW